MFKPGLKIHISITLILLLCSITLLTTIVMGMYWQQSLISSEAERINNVLNITSKKLQLEATLEKPVSKDWISDITESSSLECLAILSASGETLISGTCRHTGLLSATLQKSLQTRSQTVETRGSTWGIFTYRPEYLSIALPVATEPDRTGIGAVVSLKPVYSRIREKQKVILVYLLVNILLIGTIGFFRLVKSTVKPVERLVRITEEYDENNELVVFKGREGSEFGLLTSALNRMVRRIENDRRQLRETVASLEEANKRLQQAQDELVRTEKLASIGRLSAGLAHEIGNPIGIIQGYLELLQRANLSEEDRLQFAGRAAGELNRINQLIRQLLDFARSSSTIQKEFHVNDLLQDMVDLFQARKKMAHIDFHIEPLDDDDRIETSEEGLRQVLLNCLLNAVDAIEEQGPDHPGRINVRSRAETYDGIPCVAIAVEDNGCGMDPSHLKTIFDPFFTTKEPGKGTGLGLSVSYTIVESLGGRIAVQSEPGQGTEIKIILPRSK